MNRAYRGVDIPAPVVLEVLRRRGATALYHANTVRTACTFLRAGALLSRAEAERCGLAQTPQRSDPLDIRYGIFDDIFLDPADFHTRYRRPNHYGPVSFVFHLALLDVPDLSPIWVTRTNPVNWEAPEKAQFGRAGYFDSVAGFEGGYDLRDPGMSLTLVSTARLPLLPALRQIIVDEPERTYGPDSFADLAFAALSAAAREGGVQLGGGGIELTYRSCERDCECVREYAGLWDRPLREKFLP